MQANWSLILNILLLIGVITAIGRLMKSRKQSLSVDEPQSFAPQNEKSLYDVPLYNDDIIAVRKVNKDMILEEGVVAAEEHSLLKKAPVQPVLVVEKVPVVAPKEDKTIASSTIMMFLLAKEKRQLAGYELLQTVLASGLRFGEGHLFHRHQFINGQGPVLCSLAAATPTGIFDLQNIGAFSVRGLCLFMHASKNATIDEERFSIMLETARQLSEGLDAHLLDQQRKPLTDESIACYRQLLNIEQVEDVSVSA